MRSAALFFFLSLVVSATGAQALSQGDFLVSDLANARVLRVRANGVVSVLSPRAGSGPNLLDAPTGIAITPDQRIFVVDNDTDSLIEIDATTGAQTEIPLFRIVDGNYVASSTGQEPWGLVIDDFGALWVSASASNIVRRIGIATGVVETVLTANDLGTGSGPYGLQVRHGGLATQVLVANGSAGIRILSPTDDETFPPSDVNATVWAVDLTDGEGLDILFSLQRVPGSGAFSCGAASGLYGNLLGESSPLVTGGLIRCPFAMVRVGAFYVAEAESTIGGNARIVRITTAGSFVASVFANLPDGASDTIPAGIAYVAVPEAASGAASVIAFACLLMRWRQAASRPIQLRS